MADINYNSTTKKPATQAAPLTGSRALTSDANGDVSSSSVTSTELGYVSGVTSSIQTQINSVSVPVGSTSVNIRASIPADWAKANGQAISRTTYSDLFAEIGTEFGPGDGSTTFNLPSIYTPLPGYDKSFELPAIRQYGQLLALPDGRFVFIGGANGANAAQDSVYIGKSQNQGNITWVTSTALPAARQKHSASILNDGRILVCGGNNAGNQDDTYFGVVSGDTITWSAGTLMTGNRMLQGQVTLPDGRILLTGGDVAGAASTITEFGTISGDTITWASGTALPGAMKEHGFVVLPDGLCVRLGGFNGVTYVATVNILSIAVNVITYISATSFSEGKADFGACTLNDGRIYVVGGYNGVAAVGTAFVGKPSLNDAGTYNIEWITSPSLPSGVALFANGVCNTIQGHLIHAAGNDNTSTPQKLVYKSYSPPTIIKVS